MRTDLGSSRFCLNDRFFFAVDCEKVSGDDICLDKGKIEIFIGSWYSLC